MDGIDISHHQPNFPVSSISAKFIICKATEGVGYTDPRFGVHASQIKSAKKLRGFYHFARGDLNPGSSGAKKEAAWFSETVGPHVDGETLLVLDWEAGSIKQGPAWAKVWLEEVERLTGVRPILYTYHAVVNGYDWSSLTKYPLWYARYPSSARTGYQAKAQPEVKYWGRPIIWQYSSSGQLSGYSGRLDLNRAYITAAEWKRLGARRSGASAEPTGADLVAAAKRYLGVPYVWGGTSKDGLDCSGLIVRSLEDLGARGSFPRVSSDQINACAPVSVQEALNTPGALVWFDGHDALSLGDGKGTIEAVVNPGNKVATFTTTSRWKRGGLIPGIDYGKGAPVAPYMGPVMEGRLTSKFGWRKLNGADNWHGGIDVAPPIAGKVGTPVYAVLPGVVEGVVHGRKHGQPATQGTVVWKHYSGNGGRVRNADREQQLYIHVDFVVKNGERVKTGDLLGYTDRSGIQTGPHVHLTFLDASGKEYDPMLIFNKHGVAPNGKPITSVAKDWFDMATKKDLEDAIWGVLGTHNISISGATKRALGVDQRSAFSLIRYAAAALFEAREQHADLVAQNRALVAAVEALAGSAGLDPVDVSSAVNSAVADALADLSITLKVDASEDLVDDELEVA